MSKPNLDPMVVHRLRWIQQELEGADQVLSLIVAKFESAEAAERSEEFNWLPALRLAGRVLSDDVMTELGKLLGDIDDDIPAAKGDQP